MRCFLVAATLAVANANDCGELRQLPVCNDCDSETSRFACVGGSGSCTRRLLLAASVSCSGRHALLSRELRRGLELFAQEIARSPALGFWGERLTVQLWLVDDKSDPEEVRRIYANFSAQTGNLRPDALIGPFSSELSAAAAEATSGSGLLLLLPGASSPSVFRFDHLLGLCAPAPTYMVDALRRSQDLEPTSAVLAFAPSDFASTACGGAYEQAKGMGLKVLKNISWSLEEMTSVVQEMKALQPDLVIGCGYVREASLLIVSSMALDFNPKAFILTQASHPDLITAVEARNANFISGPSAWLPELGDDSCAQATCSSFRNGSHFSAAYAAMFGGDPAYQSAAAAAAGIVFLELVRRSEFYDPTELRSKALQGSFNTFYGRLTFNSNGMLDDDAIMARTVQLKPLPESAPPMDRYLLTSVKVLGKGGEAMEELPTWDQKRLMVYPCHDGYALQGGTCVPCEAGSYRHAKSTSCHTCERGTYSSAPGAAYCRPCPRGADCNHLGTASPDALPGFYRMPWSGDELMPWNFQPCRPASICLGGNQCAGSNTGTLCEQCLPGTTNQRSLNIGTGRGHCLECPPPEINITLVVVLIMGCVLYAGVVFRATIASALSVRHLQSIILKIVINYIVFAQVALQGTGFWSQIWNELQESTPAEQGQIFISYDCLLEHQSAWDLFRAQMNVTILLLPVALLTNILFCIVRNVILICRIKRNQRILERLRQFDDHSWNWTSATRHVPEDELMPRKDSMLSSQSSQSSETLQESLESSYAEVSPSAGLASKEHTAEEIKQWKEFRLSIVQSSVVWAFVLYPIIIQALLKGTICQEFDTLRLNVNLDIVCFSPEHAQIFALCISGLFLYGLGIPAVFFWLLYRRRHRLMMPSTRRKLGFLYNGFQLKSYHFECVYMLRKFSILLAASLPQQTVRSTIMLCLGMYFFIDHLRLDPFDNREYRVLDKLELLNLWCLVVTLLGVSLFEEASGIDGDSPSLVTAILKSVPFKAIVVTVVIVSHLVFWCYVLRALINDIIVRPLRLKALTGMKLHCWHYALLAFYRLCVGSGNMLVFEAKDNSLDVSALSQRERRFLTHALESTLECYMNCSGKAHPGLVSVALREAVLICQRTRRLQVQWLRRHEHISVPCLAGLWAQAQARLYLCYCALVEFIAKRCGRKESGPDLRHQQSAFQMPVTRFETAMRLAAFRENQPTICEFFVEELHDALMVLWPEIKRGWPELHHLPAEMPEPKFQVWKSQGAEAFMSSMPANSLWCQALAPREDTSGLTARSMASINSAPASAAASAHPPASSSSAAEVADEAPDEAAAPEWLRHMLDAENTQSELARSITAQRRANERSFRLACLLLLERRRAQRTQQSLEDALDKMAMLNASSGLQGTKPVNRQISVNLGLLAGYEAMLPRRSMSLPQPTARSSRKPSKDSTKCMMVSESPATPRGTSEYVEQEESPAAPREASPRRPQKAPAPRPASASKADSKAVPPLQLQGVQARQAAQAKAAPTLLETSPKSRLPWGTSLIRTWGKPIEPKPASAASAKAKAPGVSGSRPELASPGARQNWFGALRPVEDLELVGPEAPPETWQDPPDINYAYWRRTRQREDVTASEKGKGTGKSSAKSHAPSSWRRRVEGGER